MDQLSLSPLGLFEQAGPVGKAVMAVLLVASIWSWALILEGLVSAWRLRRALQRARFASASTPPLFVAPVFAAGEEALAVTIAAETYAVLPSRVRQPRWRAPAGICCCAPKAGSPISPSSRRSRRLSAFSARSGAS